MSQLRIRQAPLLLMLACLGSMRAEDLRVRLAAELRAGGEDGARASLAYSDGVAVRLPEDTEFLDGIELELRIPKAAQAIKGAFLLMVYKRVSPDPGLDRVAYAGQRLASLVVPSKVSQSYRLPLRPDHGIKPSPYAADLPMVSPADFPLIVRLMPAMKGMSEELEVAAFVLSAKPILRDEGQVRLVFDWPEDATPESGLSASIDDHPLEDHLKPINLRSGNHALRVSGPELRDEYIVFDLAKGQRLTIRVALKGVVPRVILEYPEKAWAEMDGKRLEARPGEAFAVTPGEHVFSFSIGDYAVQRRIMVARGRTYRISLSMDLRVEEVE